MSCTPLEIDDLILTESADAEWSDTSPSDPVGERVVTISGDDLCVNGNPVHSTVAGGKLRYWLFGAAGNLLVLDSRPSGGIGVVHTVHLVEFTDPTVTEHVLLSTTAISNAVNHPIVRADTTGTIFLIYALDGTGKVTKLAFRRSDDGGVLLEREDPQPFVPTGPIIGRFRNDVATLTIECPGGNEAGFVSCQLWKLVVDAPNSHGFDAVVGDEWPAHEQTFYLVNKGKDCLRISAVAAGSPPWTVTAQTPAFVGPNERLPITVAFKPPAVGSYGPTSFDIIYTPTQVASLECAGNGRLPVTKVTFEPSSLSLHFDTTEGQTSAPQVFRIRNVGDLPLTVDYAAPGGGSPFSWQGCEAGGATMAPGSIRDVPITFAPPDPQDYDDALEVVSNAPGSPHLLALSGTGLAQPDAHHDLFIRDNLLDDGTEPLIGGGISSSPDVILRNAPCADPQSDFGSPAVQQQDTLSEPVEAGQDNYLYLRIQNRGPEAGTGTATVYWSMPSMLPTPAQWNAIGTIGIPSVSPGEMKVVGPIVWSKDAIPGPGHYCFVALVDSPGEPAPTPGNITTIDDFFSLIREKNNVTWRNFDVVDAMPGTRHVLSARLGGWPRTSIHSDLVIDARSLPSDAVVTLRLPKRLDEQAVPQGLTPVRETTHERTYRVSTSELCRLAAMRIRGSEGYQAVLAVEVPETIPHGAYRVSLAQTVLGREMGRVSSVLSIGDHPFVGNSRTDEVHDAKCEWVREIRPDRRVAFRSVERALKQGFNGCRYCLPEHDRESPGDPS